MNRTIFLPLIILLFISTACTESTIQIVESPHDLTFDYLPKTWDEGIPLGNGMLGALIWEKEGKLRFSLDRADLWDLRPMENLQTDKWKFSWVYDQWKNDNYREVQEQFDIPYDRLPAPTKIPAGALEFNLKKYGKVNSVNLHLQQAISEITWEDGKRMQSFVHASEPIGWFRFVGFDDDFKPVLVPPAYQGKETEKEAINSLSGQNLQRLGYTQGKVEKTSNSITYTQQGWGGFTYQIHVSWKKDDSGLVGCWSISSDYPGWEKKPVAKTVVSKNEESLFVDAFKTHETWWSEYWSRSGVKLPDSLLEKQWYLEMYKFGSAARADAPPIALQAVWTADNGKIPPWKGDFHHDLNTQLSYWPAYSGNHMDLEVGYINWLWKYRDTFKKYTKEFYGTNGLNVPGVTTLDGIPMGGWIQYSFGPTVSAWLGHHFYLHWQYTMDRNFLEEKAYPWIKDVAIYFDELSVKNKNGIRGLPLSSSPEIFNNSRKAWFDEITNYDLALIRWTFTKAAELAIELGKKEEADKWSQILSEWPEFAIDPKEGLMFSKSLKYFESHRHFSHLMAIHPLGLIDYENGAHDQKVISNTIKNLDEKGPEHWTGYSYSWEGNLKARAMDGEGAAQALRIFAEAFCLPNSFHVNGDQSGKGYSGMTYRPFTLEGNFAFASGINEMLLQSHTGIVHIFPAVPADWKNISFGNLRTVGAFLVSAQKEQGDLSFVSIVSEKGGKFKMKNPFSSNEIKTDKKIHAVDGILEIDMEAGEKVVLEMKRNP